LYPESLERIIREVAEKTTEELESSFSRFIEDLRERVGREREEVSKTVVSFLEDLEKKSSMIRSRILSLTQVKIRGMKLETIERCVENVIRKMLEEIDIKARRGELNNVLEKMLEEAVEIVGGNHVKIYTNTFLKDSLKKISENVSSKKNIKIEVRDEPVETVFGLVARSLDDSISYDNRIEVRIERLKPAIRKIVASMLT